MSDAVAARPVQPQPVLGLPDPGEQVPRLAWPTALLWLGSLVLSVVTLLGIGAWDWSRWATVPMTAAVTFLMFSVLHEATHHAVSTDTRVNNTFGHVSVPFVAPYASFGLIKFIHIEHHRNTNEPMQVDPDNWTSTGPWWQLPLRWATIDLWYVVFYARRVKERPRREVVVALGVVAAFAAGATILVVGGFGVELVTWLVGQRIGLTVLSWWFDYLPHHGLTATQRADKYRATRVRVGGEGWLTPLFVYQNYHLVHHLHPSVPFYRYIRAWRRNEQAYLDRNAAISTWFGRSLTPSEYRTWRRLTDDIDAEVVRGGSPSHRPTFHPLRVQAVEPLTDDAVLVTFDVPADLADAYRYREGQHVTLRAVVGGRELRRSYSIVQPASARTLQVAVKRIDGGAFSTYVHEELQVDDILDVMVPTGRFHTELDPTRARHLVAVAAGSGITPLMSIIATTLEVEPQSRFTLVLGNRTAASTMFREELDDLAASTGGRLVVHHVWSQQDGGAHRGRIDAAVLRSLVAEPVDTWFLCGPQALVEGLVADLDGEQVLTELFYTEAAESQVAIDVESRVTITLDGAESSFALRSSGDSVLDAALQQGLEPPYSCAGGACGTCRAKVVLGRAVMDQNHALTDTEVEAGYVLTCQAHPVTEQVRVDYDA